MLHILRRMLGWLGVLALLAATPAVAADKVKYAKTEVEKARGACVGTVVLGALLGAAIGRATGRGNTGLGLGLGAAAGGVACAAIMANARHKDRIIAAQIAAAQYTTSPYVTTFHDDQSGTDTRFQGQAVSQQIDGARLQPVRYGPDKTGSPVLGEGMQDCRAVSSSLTDAQGTAAALPTQYVCRTPDGDYEPYAMQKA